MHGREGENDAITNLVSKSETDATEGEGALVWAPAGRPRQPMQDKLKNPFAVQDKLLNIPPVICLHSGEKN